MVWTLIDHGKLTNQIAILAAIVVKKFLHCCLEDRTGFFVLFPLILKQPNTGTQTNVHFSVQTAYDSRSFLFAVSPRVLVRGGRGFCAGAPHGLQLGFGCQVICVLLLDSSHCDFITGPPLPLALVSMW